MENIRTYEEMENYGSNGRRMELMSKIIFMLLVVNMKSRFMVGRLH